LAGAGVLLLVAGAVAYYLTQMPGKLADDYKEKAEPQQHVLVGALRLVDRACVGAEGLDRQRARDMERALLRAYERL
jgi:hypothetical protein